MRITGEVLVDFRAVDEIERRGFIIVMTECILETDMTENEEMISVKSVIHSSTGDLTKNIGK